MENNEMDICAIQDKIAQIKAHATINDCLEKTKACIREKPLKAVGMAFIAGCIFKGMMIHRHLRRWK